MDGQTDDGLTDEKINRWMNGWADSWIDKWLDEITGGWMDATNQSNKM